MPSNPPDSADADASPRLWRSVDEYADTEEFARYLHREFPERAPEWLDPESRRGFLKLMGASLALAGVSTGITGCDLAKAPQGHVLPYVRQPENIVQGKSLDYATAISLNGFGMGVLAESNMGRPTLLEGNEKHPDSLGSIDYFTQSALLSLYDPDRSKVVMHRKLIGSFDAFLLEASSRLDALKPAKGAGLRLLTETVTSPTLARQIKALLAAFPEARWHQYDPAGPHSARAGARLAFDQDISVRHDIEKADVIVSLDADFLSCGFPGSIPMSRAFARRREPADNRVMNRLYVVEPSVSVTGSSSDHRLPLSALNVAALGWALAEAVGVKVPKAPAFPDRTPGAKFLKAVVDDLKASQGKCLVIAGDSQPPFVHALAHAINETLGNVGATVSYFEPVEEEPTDQIASLADLSKAMASGLVDTLFIIGGNPVYNAPSDLKFDDGLVQVKFSARLAYYEDETSALCHWHLPESHELEAWGDVRATDGTVTIQQPLIAPLHGTSRSASELLAALLGHPDRAGSEIVRASWKAKTPEGQDFETFWRISVHDGVVEGTKKAAAMVKLKGDLGPPATFGPRGASTLPFPESANNLEVIFRPDSTIFDGRFANNGWLQELPKPITKLTWDNVALMSEATGRKYGVSGGVSGDGKSADVARLTFQGRSIEAPVWIMPGHADGSVTLTLGYGRSKSGQVGQGIGYNASILRTSRAMSSSVGLDLTRTRKTQRIACTQTHRMLEETRGLIRSTGVDAFKKEPDFAHKPPYAEEPKAGQTMYFDDHVKAPPGEPNHQWAMVINLNTCTGCSACVTACVAENNTPVIGKDQVLASREMHWMEIDRYFSGPINDPEVHHQPRTCMHCEKAPCELVCPVEATMHDSEGLNLMVYNRCIGTRYCSNNCPYKVRHFNFLQYSPKLDDSRTPSLALHYNPDVSVRARGVMEKCTYCIQRINEARYSAELEGRPMKDGDVITACQAACPTRAITFGDLSEPGSAVNARKADPRNYALLAELNTRPRTTYLAKLKNPNPALAPATGTESSHGD